MKKVILVFIAIAFICYSSLAQFNLPHASPDAELKQQVGFTDVVIKYSRPGAKGRKIFGSLVPYAELWRTGASDATTIHFSDTVKLNGNIVPKGTYSLFSIPDKEEWTIILNKDTAMHGASNYTKDLDLVRFNVKSETTPRYYETFSIEVNDIIKESAAIYIVWENTQVRINLGTDADEKIMAQIRDAIINRKEDKPSLYFQASSYYFNNGKDLNTALDWIKLANKKGDEVMYFQLQAKIEAALGDYAKAIKSAETSSRLAKEKKLDQVITANQKLITDWTSKLSKK
ncbi:MAG: DUF2911 domain-containing protein [Chryseolinea sp.]